MSLSLLAWRRRVHDLYAEVRAASPTDGHDLWRAGRDTLLGSHPDSPLMREVRRCETAAQGEPGLPARERLGHAGATVR